MTDEQDRPIDTPPPQPAVEPPAPEVPVATPAAEPPAPEVPVATPAAEPPETEAPMAAPAVPAAGPPLDPTADQPSSPSDAGQSRRRWVVAIAIVALIAAGIGLVAFLAGRGGLAAIAPRYLPATTVAYSDVRFDLPGTQREEVSELLARFPGFEDASTLELKADDTFDRLVKSATEDEISYTGDIKPWFGGQVALGMTGLPNLGSLITGGGTGLELPVIGLISVKDAAAAEATLDRFAVEAQAAGMTVVTGEVDGHPTWTISDQGGTDTGPRSATVTLTSDMLLVGMDAAAVAESVRLGTQGGANLAGSSAFSEATAELPEARLATLYLDGAALKLAGGALTAVPGLEAALESIPVSVAGALTVTDGTITATAQTVHPEGAVRSVDAPSTLAGQVPGTSLTYLEVHDVGTAFSALLAQAKSQPDIEAFGLPIESIESLLGAKLEDLFTWVGDVAVVGWTADAQPAGAVLAEVTDATAADERMRQLQAFLQLAGIGGAVTTSTSTHAGATITSVNISDAGQDVTVSFTLSDDMFVLGLGEASVMAILEVTPETALAADPGYQATMSAAGPSTNAGSAYVDLRGIREATEPVIPARERARYEQEVRPWLLPFDQLGSVTYQDGSATVAQTVITTLQP
jgi:Protein of unknown function (DUF3352)